MWITGLADETALSLYQLSGTELAILAAYFVTMGVLSVYGFHRYQLIYLYYKHRFDVNEAPAQPVLSGATVAENAALLNLIAGYDRADPASARRAQEDFSVGVGRGITGLRLGALRHFYVRDLVADSVVTEAIETALGVFESLGAEVAEISGNVLSALRLL